MNFTVYNLVYLIICIAEALIACQYFGSIRMYEGSRSIQFASCGVCYALIYLMQFLSDGAGISLLLFFVLNFLLGYFLHGISPGRAALAAGIMAALLLAAEWMMNGIVNSMFIMAGGSQKTLGTIALSAVMARLLYLVFMWILIRIWCILNRDDEEYCVFGMVSLYLVTAASCLVVGVLAELEIRRLITGRMRWMTVCGAMAILLANVLIYWNSSQSRRHYREYTETQVQLEKENAQAEYYRMLAKRSEEQKILIHDIRKHLSQLDSLLQTQDYANASAYVNELLGTPALQPAVRICDNEMASLILGQYKERCREQKVQFYPDVRSKCLDFLSLKELTALLSNLLDNALEASAGAPDAFIDLRIVQKAKTQVVIRMDNSCTIPPRLSKQGALLTHKPDAAKHGFGMKSIGGILKKYNGTIETIYDEKKQVFHTIIYMSVHNFM